MKIRHVMAFSAVILSVTAVSAKDINVAEMADMIAYMEIYDANCSTLSPFTRQVVDKMHHFVERSDIAMPMLNRQMDMQRMGKELWCKVVRPMAEAADSSTTGQGR